jgi:hypothetical protein
MFFPDAQWAVVARPSGMFELILIFSALSIVSLAFKVLFEMGNLKRALFALPLNLLDLILSLSVIILSFVKNGI